MFEAFMLTEVAKETATVLPTWQFFGGSAVGAALATGVFAIIKTILDKKVRPVVTVETQTQALLGGLERMVTLMTEDKAKDAERIGTLQGRVDELEMDSQRDLEAITRLHGEIRTLQADAARKDSTIRLLVNELSVLGTIAHGLEESALATITFERKRNHEIND